MNKIKELITQYGGLKKELYILFVGRLVTSMGAFVWPMLTFFLTIRLGMTDAMAAFWIATAALLMLPATLLGGKLADKYDRKRIIVIFDSVSIALYFVSALIPISYATAIVLFFAGLAQNIEGPAYDALTADFSLPSQREKAYSLTYLGYNIGFIIGATVSGILFEKNTLLAFFLNGVAILISTVLIGIFIHSENAVRYDEETVSGSYSKYEMPADEGLSVFKVLKDRKVVFWALMLGCFACLPSTVTGILLPLQLKKVTGGAELYGFMNSLNGFVVIIFTPILTVLLKKITELPKVAAGLILYISGMMFYAFSKQTWLLFVGMFVFTLGEVVTVLGNNPYMTRRTPSSHWGRVGGLLTVSYSLFTSLTQYLVSWILRDESNTYLTIWMIFIACGGFAVLLYMALYPYDKQRFPKLYTGQKL